MNDAGKSGKSPGSSVGGSSGSTNDYNGYVPATGYRLGTTILSASVMDMQLALDTDDLDKEMRGTNKTLAPTPGFDRPSVSVHVTMNFCLIFPPSNKSQMFFPIKDSIPHRVYSTPCP